MEEARARVGGFLVPNVCALPFWKQPLRRCMTGEIGGDALWITFHEPLVSRGHRGLTFFGRFTPEGSGCLLRGSFTYPWWSKTLYLAMVGLFLLLVPFGGGAVPLILVVASRLALEWMPSFLSPRIEALQEALRGAVGECLPPNQNSAS